MGATVLCARVARQLTRIHYQKLAPDGPSAAHAAAMAMRSLPLDYPGFLRFALHSLTVYLDQGMNSATWLSNVLEAAHFGSSFRRCFFFDYKDNRRPYPRVTNRGVQTSKKGRQSQLRKG